MAEAYPEVLRSRVVQAYEMGEGSYATVATQWYLGTATVKRWVAQQRREGYVRPRPKAGGTTRLPAAETGPPRPRSARGSWPAHFVLLFDLYRIPGVHEVQVAGVL